MSNDNPNGCNCMVCCLVMSMIALAIAAGIVVSIFVYKLW